MHQVAIVRAVALFYSGFAQLVAGILCFFAGNSFSYVALFSYGCFWMSFAYILNDSSGIQAAYDSTQHFCIAMGHYLFVWTIFTTMMFILTFRTTVTFFGLFLFVEIRFILLTISYYIAVDGNPNVNCAKAAGYVYSPTSIMFIAFFVLFYFISSHYHYSPFLIIS